MCKSICNIPLNVWKEQYPILDSIINTNEVFWRNPNYTKYEIAKNDFSISIKDVLDAENRLNKFAPLIAKLFPETQKSNGIIESPLIEIPNMKNKLSKIYKKDFNGNLFLKCDNKLPIAGSIKARGGIYEVLKYTEDLALKNNLINKTDNYSIFANKEFKNFFKNYTIQVGSTGNLGLSIGMISSKLGFKTIVHMSKDAKEWKKNLLRKNNVCVIEYLDDYSKAVCEGRKTSDKDPNSYFIDDENSINLFLGYSTAALRLKKQLENLNIKVDANNQLFVYLPCGVGGSPGGIAFGLKLLFKDNVHCFFVEPTHSPCMLIGMLTGQNNNICVQDFGIDNITIADGLAVGRASGFVGNLLKKTIDGIYTLNDETLITLLRYIKDTEDIKLEPSACAGLNGYALVQENLNLNFKNSTHIAWATGGNLVPQNIYFDFYK